MSTDRSPTRVVVVEDSLVQRANLIAVLEADGDIEVIGEAATAPEAIAMVAALRPDVVTLDLNIPGGGGPYALEQIMATTPTPVLVLSATVQDGTSVAAVESLVAGALLAVPKPARWTPAFEAGLRRDVRMIRKVVVIRHLRGARNRPVTPPTRSSSTRVPGPPVPGSRVPGPPVPGPRVSGPRVSGPRVSGPPVSGSRVSGSRVSGPPVRDTVVPGAPLPGMVPCVVAIAASTGGPAALATVLGGLAGLTVPVLIVQHIHPDFVQGLIDWMSKASPLAVELAHHGQVLRGGRVYIGPGGTHLRVGRDRRIELVEAPETIHRPSADQLFGSIATRAGSNSVGVVLTGMGNDGAVGLAAMHRSGAHTIVQDEATSAVYGMPRAAARLGVADQQLPLPAIAGAIMAAVRGKVSVRA